MQNSLFDRRTTLVGLAASVAGFAMPSAVLALTEQGATALVDQLVGEINKVISSGKSESAMIKDFEKIFVRYADVPIMAKYALGNDGRTASAAQIKNFTRAFQGYISRKYGKQFRDFIGGQVIVQSSRKIKSGYEIKSTVKLQGQKPFEVTFLVSDRSGRDLFFNMFIEGVNMLLAERAEIGAMLDRRGGNIDQMTADLAKAG
jgi:phospholipid transport system substrate-binding protein